MIKSARACDEQEEEHHFPASDKAGEASVRELVFYSACFMLHGRIGSLAKSVPAAV